MGNLFYDEPAGSVAPEPPQMVDHFGRPLLTVLTFDGITWRVGDKIVRLDHPYNNDQLAPNRVYTVHMLRGTTSVQLAADGEFWGLEYFRPATAADLRDLPHG